MSEPVESVHDSVVQTPDEIVGRSRAMAGPILIRLPYRCREAGVAGSADCDDAEALRLSERVGQLLSGFHAFERACTRFAPDSDLSRLNAAPRRWHRVPPVLLDAIWTARLAHETTDGLFDPRVLAELLALGYDASLRFGDDASAALQPMARPVARRGKWNPLFVRALRAVHLRGEAIDLGGIGKGLAVGRCAIELARDRRDFLIDAGGDCYCAGRSAGGTPWRVGVEDPFGGADPVAVLEVSDRAVATSSTRLRHWRVGATQVHHLIDPATGQPGGTGLRSVTVVGPEPAWAEVWAKVLFLRGRDGIAGAAEHGQLEALWIDDQGEVGVSGALGPTMIWSRS